MPKPVGEVGGGIANVLSTLNVYEIEKIQPRPVIKYNGIAVSTVQLCAGSTATLTVNAPITGTTYNWYTAATGGTAVATGNSFTTAALTATTNYFVEAANGTCTSTSRTQVTATVTPLPAAPVELGAGGGGHLPGEPGGQPRSGGDPRARGDRADRVEES